MATHTDDPAPDKRPSEPCERHTEHAVRGGAEGVVGRYFPAWNVGGAGLWERCEVETTRFYAPSQQ